MQVVAAVWGVLALSGMLIAFFPCLGALNWINIPFSGLGLVFSVTALATSGDRPKGASIAGTIACAVAVLFGMFRLIIGGGIL